MQSPAVVKDSPKQAVVLSGGGAYAAYEVGVLNALFKGESSFPPLTPDIFTGTSGGAFNASFLVCRQQGGLIAAVEALERTWRSRIAGNRCGNGVYRLRGDPFEYLNPECILRRPLELMGELAGDSMFLLQDWSRRAALFARDTKHSFEDKALALLDISALVENAPILKTIQDTINLDEIRRSTIQLRIAATDWEEGELKIIGNDQMSDDLGHQYIAASAAIPGFFPPISIAGAPWVDGGVLQNTPLELALPLGATTLHIIYMDPDLKKRSRLGAAEYARDLRPPCGDSKRPED